MDPCTFVDNLKRSRLLDQEQFIQVERLAEEVPAAELPGVLVADGVLTEFQSRAVAAGNVPRLVLGAYELLDELGRGGMGIVYKALHRVMGRVVALKVVAPELGSNEKSREWFLREVRTVTRLLHPNIVIAHDANEVEGEFYLAMEYVEGTTLDALVRSQGPLPVGLACELIRQAALGLQHAHEKGLVHRDIKPANLLLTRPPVLLKVADFGLARLNGLHGGNTIARHSTNGLLGTPDYVAPEQCRDSHTVDIRADLYSLGCVLHFALVGRAPFAGDSVMEKLFKHATEMPPPVESLRPDVPAAVAAIVARLLAKDPLERYQTPGELAVALAPWCDDGAAALPQGNGLLTPLPGSAIDPGRTAATPLPVDRKPSVALQWVSEPDLALTSSSVVPSDSILGEAPGVQTSPGPALLLAPPPPRAAPLVDESRHARPARQQRANTLVLRRGWASWTALVEALVRRPDQQPGGEQAYQELYQVLVRECAAHAEEATEDSRPFFHHLEELVEPWMSLAVLTRTEPALLQDLALRARRAGLDLAVPSPQDLALRARRVGEGLGVAPSGGWNPWLLGAALVAAAGLVWLPVPLSSALVLILAGLAAWLLLRRRA